MFVGMEAQDRRIWLVSPYNSSRGNSAVVLYISNVNRWLFSQTFKSLKFLIDRFPVSGFRSLLF